jgi:hypothetical protein
MAVAGTHALFREAKRIFLNMQAEVVDPKLRRWGLAGLPPHPWATGFRFDSLIAFPERLKGPGLT